MMINLKNGPAQNPMLMLLISKKEEFLDPRQLWCMWLKTIIARHHSKIELPGIQGVCKMELLSKPQNERYISTLPVLFCIYKENVQIENIFGQIKTSLTIAIFSEK